MPLEGFKKKKKKNGEKMLFLGGKCDVMTIQIWTSLQFFRKSVFLKGRVKKNRKIGKKCHLLHGRVIKMGKI